MEKKICNHLRCKTFDAYRQFKSDDYNGFDCMLNHGARPDMVDKPWEYNNFEPTFYDLKEINKEVNKD